MPEPKFLKSAHGEVVQAFPLTTDDKCNLTTAGTATGVTLIHCVSAGTVAVTFKDGSGPTNITMVAGQDFAFPGGASISITSGTYHIA